ncbi:MAG TPA: hypothetical protein VF041_08230 [Gemmatimonadaceae bacterium]
MRAIGVVARGVAAALALGVPAAAGAQQQPRKTPRGGEPIVIRGQVPTPQVVTVRPRQVPEYDRGVLGPELRQRSFWPGLAPGYQLVPGRQVSGRATLDTVPGAMVAAEPGEAGSAAAGAAPADSATSPERAAQIEAMRRELAVRRARLDSLQRALRGESARAETARGLGTVPRRSAADSAARAAEIDALMKELEFRRARLDSLEVLVRDLGRPRAPADTTRSPRDSSARPRR